MYVKGCNQYKLCACFGVKLLIPPIHKHLDKILDFLNDLPSHGLSVWVAYS